MVENIKLDKFPKESGAYLFKVDDEVIYVGSSVNLYNRMSVHKTAIKQGSSYGHKQDLYQYLQINTFTVEFQLTDDYRQLEQELVERYNPRYNSHRAYTGLGASKGREAEYDKQYKKKYKEEIKQYNNQLCYFNNEVLTLCALQMRFGKQGIQHPQIEAKRYLIRSSNND